MVTKTLSLKERKEARAMRMENRKKEMMALASKTRVGGVKNSLKKSAVSFIKKQVKEPKNKEFVKGIAKEATSELLNNPELNEYLYGVPKRLLGAAHNAIDAADINMGPRYFEE